MASSAFPPPDVALSLTPTGPELEPRPPQEWPIQRDSEKSNGQGFLSAWDDKARQAHKDVLPPGGLSTGTTPKSVLNSKVLTAMGIVPGPFEHPIEPKDMLESIEAVVQLILYDSSEPKEDPHFTAGSWLSTCFTVRGRVPVLTSPVWQFIAVVNVGLFFVLEWVGKNEEVEKSKASTFFETVLTLEFTPLRLMSVGLMFLLIFRTQSAYQKWNVARKEWASVTLACRDVAMNVCTYNRDLYAVLTMCRYLLLFVISLRYWLRETPISHDLLGQLATPKLKRLLRSAEQEQDLVGVSAPRRRLLSDDRLSFQFKNVCYPLMMMEGIRALLNVSVEQGAMPPFHGSIEQSTKVMGTALCRMEAVQDTELPFAYVVHIRTTTILFFLIAPVFLVHPEDGLGWFGLVFTLGFAAILLGLENLAEELSNPFGLDSNDLPSDLYTCNLARDIGDAVRRRLAREDALSGAGSASPGGAGTLDLPTGPPAEPPAL